MRIVGGDARGRTLKGPPDALTRATADKVRESIYNVLAPYVEGARVLDLYAGTGALGVEALSRGAAGCDFIERRRQLCLIIEENLALASLNASARVICAVVPQALSTLTGPYDLILADPPYADLEASRIVTMPELHSLLVPDGIVVFEHSSRVTVAGDVGPLRYVRTRRYGDSAVSFWQRRAEGTDG